MSNRVLGRADWSAKGWPASGTTIITITTILVVLVAGCGGGPPPLMATPNIYANGDRTPFADVPPALQSNTVDVLYVTDRAHEEGSTPDHPKYGSRRSRSVAFGVCQVRFGDKDVTWDELVTASTQQKRKDELEIAVTGAKELCVFPPTPRTLIELPRPEGQPGPTTLEAELNEDMEITRQELRTRLAQTPSKEVYIFVHGVKTNFTGAVITIAQLWHFLGREGVPIAYTWPAGGQGLLRGYNYDYNSSEFTVYHLKQTIRAIADTSEVEKINVIAHSRGTDVVVSALRELHIEYAAAGLSTRKELKLGTFVLAAPDLDVDVVFQRAATARLGTVPERSVVYICDEDKALAMSRYLFRSMRLGSLKPEIFTDEELEALRTSRQISFIDARVTKPGAFGHNYFYSNPAVSSDLILLMRYRRGAGAENGRPLKAVPHGFWSIDDKYPGATTQPSVMVNAN